MASPLHSTRTWKAIIPNDGITAVFLRWALQSLHEYLLSKVRESAHGTKKLETAVLTGQELMVPPPALQTDFAEKVRRIEAVAHALDAAEPSPAAKSAVSEVSRAKKVLRFRRKMK